VVDGEPPTAAMGTAKAEFAVCHFSGTRQTPLPCVFQGTRRQKLKDGMASGVIHRVSTGAAHGKTGMGARRPRGSTVCFGLCHTAKSRASPCAMAAARGEARPWHMAN